MSFIDRSGENRTMNCGMKVTIIRYGSSVDIDVKFEDGTVVTNKSYANFKKGNINNPNIKNYRLKANRIGETRMMKCGMKATITRYGSATDIDVQLEDGTIVTNKEYSKFKTGNIKIPKNHTLDRLGETRMMKCGMKATIVRYGSATDIDVQFEDGTIIKNREYSAFKKGTISISKSHTLDRLGETRMMNCGMKATIIRYDSSGDIDVRFEDGTIITNREYSSFKKGTIWNPNLLSLSRLGETRTMNCGMKATIIRYGSASDIDVQFEDGTIVFNKKYGSFKKGEIAIKNIKLGETRMMNCGMKATIIKNGGRKGIDVKFEDGTVISNRGYEEFKKGGIRNPNLMSHLGEIRTMNCGMKATIISDNGYHNIDIKFEDGTILIKKDYARFKKGMIRNPNLMSHLGETRMMNCGMKATIIRDGKSTGIDIEFEDGTIVVNRRYNQFKKGEIQNPKLKCFMSRVGETRMMNCGMNATIIRYGLTGDIDVKFEDGTVVINRTYDQFIKGGISHPAFKNRFNITYKTFSGKFITRTDSETYYSCKCGKCACKDILTPQQMMAHECNNRNNMIKLL